ncbi:MAG: hypothetical protein ACTSQY_10735 [Candidatus Odinarchaeia archaeon]
MGILKPFKKEITKIKQWTINQLTKDIDMRVGSLEIVKPHTLYVDSIQPKPGNTDIIVNGKINFDKIAFENFDDTNKSTLVPMAITFWAGADWTNRTYLAFVLSKGGKFRIKTDDAYEHPAYDGNSIMFSFKTPVDQTIQIDIEHDDDVKVYINGNNLYGNLGPGSVSFYPVVYSNTKYNIILQTNNDSTSPSVNLLAVTNAFYDEYGLIPLWPAISDINMPHS